MSVRICRAAVFSLWFLLLAAAPSKAQTSQPASPPQPVTGFVPSYEIVHTLRAAGFNPLAPPLREGTIYVVRATDYRGVLMRVVVDAWTGAIRDANRIVTGPGRYGAMETEPPSYGSPHPHFGLPPYGRASRLNVAPIAIPLPRPRPADIAVGTPGMKTNDEINSDARASGAPNNTPAVVPSLND